MIKNYANMKEFMQVLREYDYRKRELNEMENFEFKSEKERRNCFNDLYCKYMRSNAEVEKYALRLLLRHKGKNNELCDKIMSLLKKHEHIAYYGIRRGNLL